MSNSALAADSLAARATMLALTDTSDVFETFFDRARVGLALADLSGRYVRINASYAELLARPAEDLIGVALEAVITGDESGLLEISALLKGERTSLQSQQQFSALDGRTTWVLHALATVLDAEGRPAWLAVSAQDISDRVRAEDELRDLTATMTERALRDPLTGLANRALLEERLRSALARDARSGQSTGVLFLDLDGFKAVNDRYGHAAGDTVLRTIAERLSHAVRPSDTVARLGGDEFVVLVEGATQPVLNRLVLRLRTAVLAPVTLDVTQVQVGVSIGMALSERGTADPLRLLSQADARMYDAKRQSR